MAEARAYAQTPGLEALSSDVDSASTSGPTIAPERRSRDSGAKPRLLWLEGHGLSFGGTISYLPFQEILWRYAGITEDDADTQKWNKLEECVRALFRELTPEILPTWLVCLPWT